MLFQLLRTCQMLPAGMRKGSGLRALTAMSRVTGLQSADAGSRSSVACQVPAAGAATSANQE